jgi:hypothetical protein
VGIDAVKSGFFSVTIDATTLLSEPFDLLDPVISQVSSCSIQQKSWGEDAEEGGGVAAASQVQSENRRGAIKLEAQGQI